MGNQTYEVDSESAICTMCGTRLNTQLGYKIHVYSLERSITSIIMKIGN